MISYSDSRQLLDWQLAATHSHDRTRTPRSSALRYVAVRAVRRCAPGTIRCVVNLQAAVLRV